MNQVNKKNNFNQNSIVGIKAYQKALRNNKLSQYLNHPNLKEKVIEWLFSYDVIDLQKIVSIENPLTCNLIYGMYLEIIHDKRISFRFKNLENFPEYYIYPTNIHNCLDKEYLIYNFVDYSTIHNTNQNRLDSGIYKNIYFYSNNLGQSFYDNMTLSSNILKDKKIFLEIFNSFSKDFFTSFPCIEQSTNKISYIKLSDKFLSELNVKNSDDVNWLNTTSNTNKNTNSYNNNFSCSTYYSLSNIIMYFLEQVIMVRYLIYLDTKTILSFRISSKEYSSIFDDFNTLTKFLTESVNKKGEKILNSIDYKDILDSVLKNSELNEIIRKKQRRETGHYKTYYANTKTLIKKKPAFDCYDSTKFKISVIQRLRLGTENFMDTIMFTTFKRIWSYDSFLSIKLLDEINKLHKEKLLEDLLENKDDWMTNNVNINTNNNKNNKNKKKKKNKNNNNNNNNIDNKDKDNSLNKNQSLNNSNVLNNNNNDKVNDLCEKDNNINYNNKNNETNAINKNSYNNKNNNEETSECKTLLNSFSYENTLNSSVNNIALTTILDMQNLKDKNEYNTNNNNNNNNYLVNCNTNISNINNADIEKLSIGSNKSYKLKRNNIKDYIICSDDTILKRDEFLNNIDDDNTKQDVNIKNNNSNSIKLSDVENQISICNNNSNMNNNIEENIMLNSTKDNISSICINNESVNNNKKNKKNKAIFLYDTTKNKKKKSFSSINIQNNSRILLNKYSKFDEKEFPFLFWQRLHNDIIDFSMSVNDNLSIVKPLKIEIINKLKKEIVNNLNSVNNVLVYGSFATDLSIESSDVDIRVIFNEKNNSSISDNINEFIEFLNNEKCKTDYLKASDNESNNNSQINVGDYSISESSLTCNSNTFNIYKKNNNNNNNNNSKKKKNIVYSNNNTINIYNNFYYIKSINPIISASVPVVKLNTCLILPNNKSNNTLSTNSKIINERLNKIKELIKTNKHLKELTSIKIDISFSQENSQESKEVNESINFITKYSLKFPEVVPIIYILKHMLQKVHFNSVYNGGIPSFSLFLIVLAFNIFQKNISKKSNTYNLGSLLYEMLDFYVNSISFLKYKIEINLIGK